MPTHTPLCIYNLFPLLTGPMPAWTSHLERAAAMGFNWIFVNPLQQSGASQSLYSIKDYFTIDSRFIAPGSKITPEKQLGKFIASADKLGLKVMVDLVINHCAVDSPLVTAHPEWFQWEAPGRIANPFAHEDGGKKVVWKDLARFDHQHTRDPEGLYQYFRKVVGHLAGLGFQGFRCDAAYQVPREIWKRLIRDISSQWPETLFVAETLGCTPDQTRATAKAGFHYIFNSAKWWDFYSPWLMNQYNLSREIAPSISFPESHDTIRLAAELDGNLNGLKQRYLFSAFFSAGVMMPIGYEFGFRRQPHVVTTTPEQWEEPATDLTGFIAAVNAMKKANPLFSEEAVTSIHGHGNPQVLVMWKASPKSGQEALLILNKDIHNPQHFHADNLASFVQGGGTFTDVSPEYALDFLPAPFAYELRPGQGIVLVTTPAHLP